MKLEEEIKQVEFKNEFQKLAVNLIFTHGWLSNIQNEFFRKSGITAIQFNILRILRGQYPNPASIHLLQNRMLDKRSDASRLVERLRSKGLVKRNVCKNDRRRVDVIISKKGLDILEKLDKHEEKFQAIFKNISEDEAAVVNDLLDKIRG